MADVPYLDLDADGEENPPACRFKLGGREWTVKSAEDIPYPLVRRLLDTSADGQGALLQIEPFFRAVLTDADVPAFTALLSDIEQSPLTIGRMTRLMEYVAGSVMSRPTTPAASSPTGSRAAGRKSAAGSSSRATRRRASAG